VATTYRSRSILPNRTVLTRFRTPIRTFTTDGISQGFDVYHRTTDTSSTEIAYYKSESTGGGVRFGFPINEHQSFSIGLAADSTSITTFDSSPTYYKKYVNDFGKTNISVPLSLNWVSDSKNSFFFPTSGTYQRAGTGNRFAGC
jgi:outer membrane protein insertion porin family